MGSFQRTREARRDVADAGAVATSAGWRSAVGVAAAIAVIGLIAVGIWYFKVATSGARGAGDATRITNDGRNRVNAQEWFQSQHGQIKAADKNLDDAAKNLRTAATPEDKSFWQTNYTGLKNRCNEMVAVYNAEAGKVSRGQWRDASLPAQIDTSDSTTDCQETAPPAPATR